jgi:2-oxo-4-hydroxy-4-carboxy-5-ureidoimidazoline decarboxylase
MSADDAGLARFNTLGGPDAADALRACCAAPGWVDAVVDGRPYPNRVAVAARADEALACLDWSGVRAALDAHPRIGERADGGGREATWSRSEQSGMDTATDDVRSALVEANRAYEERFGHVFLIFATGKTDGEMLAAAHQRLGNDEEVEQVVVRGELGRIVGLRVAKLLDSLGRAEEGE